MVKRLDPAAEGGSKRDKRKEMAEVLLPDLPRVRRKDPKIVEAGMGSARKAAVEAARKLMQKMKGSKKTSQSGADKATEKVSKTKVPRKKKTPAELREARTRFINQRSEQLRPDSAVKLREKGGKSEVVSSSVSNQMKKAMNPYGIDYDDLGRMSNEQLTNKLNEAIRFSRKDPTGFYRTNKDIANQFKELTGQSMKDLKRGRFDMNKRVVDSEGFEPFFGNKAKDGLYEFINTLYGVM